MRNIAILILVVLMAVGGSGFLYADGNPVATVNLSADVPDYLGIAVTIKDSNNAAATAMDFGELVHASTNDLNSPFISSKSFNAWISVASTHGKTYYVKQSMNHILQEAGGASIPQNAFCATTLIPSNNLGQPVPTALNGGALNNTNVPVGVSAADRILFTSSNQGGNAYFQVVYGITNHFMADGSGDGSGYNQTADICPASQKTGHYTATITYTVYD